MSDPHDRDDERTGSEDEHGGDGEDRQPLREDPETGSTPTDPSAERTGPYGTDPMGGEAPSG